MTDVRLGELAPANAQRDAIHVAVIPAVAGMDLQPGERVALSGNFAYVEVNDCRGLGIVDPFLSQAIKKGDRFYLLLLPNTVTGMRHHWEHPAVDNEDRGHTAVCTPEESKNWLTNWLNVNGCPELDVIVAAAFNRHMPDEYAEYVTCKIDDGYFHVSGMDASGMIPREFWSHLENYVGERCRYRPEMFTCGC